MRLTLATVFLTLSLSLAAAQEANILVSHPQSGVSIGFADSSFNYPNPQTTSQTEVERAIKAVKFCYTGFAQYVCAHIQSQVFKMNSRYSGGAHDRIDFLQCNVKESSDWDEREPKEVIVSYTLSDDYGTSLAVKRLIGPCMNIK